MRGVGREPAHLGEGVLQPRQHAVERVGQAVELVAGAAYRDAAGQRLGVDAARRARHLVHRPERGPRHDVAAGRGQAHAERDENQQRLQPALERLGGGPERGAHPHDLDQPLTPVAPAP